MPGVRSGKDPDNPRNYDADLSTVADRVREMLSKNLTHLAEIHQGIGDHLRSLEIELESIGGEIDRAIAEYGSAENRAKVARKKLVDASKGRDEAAQQMAYEDAQQWMVRLGVLEERERNLRQRRDALQREVKRLRDLVRRSEEMGEKLRIALDLIMSKLEDMGALSADLESRVGVLALARADRERVSLARELHDGPAQLFAGVFLMLELVERLITRGRVEDAVAEVGKAKVQIQEAMTDIRGFMWQLNPVGLEDGLDAAIERLAACYRNRYELPVSLMTHGNSLYIPLGIRETAFRIVQEALSNARKGEAKSIQILLNAGSEALLVKIFDDGKGFDVEEERRKARERGSFGLLNMSQRSEIAGGRLDIVSSPGRGSTVSFQLPYALPEKKPQD